MVELHYFLCCCCCIKPLLCQSATSCNSVIEDCQSSQSDSIKGRDLQKRQILARRDTTMPKEVDADRDVFCVSGITLWQPQIPYLLLLLYKSLDFYTGHIYHITVWEHFSQQCQCSGACAFQEQMSPAKKNQRAAGPCQSYLLIFFN